MKWFKHDSDANADNRLQNVLLDYGLEGYGLYWYCLELIAGRVDKERVTFELEHDARVIARNTGSTPQKVEEMMRYFVNIGLFENTEGVITCLKMAKRLDKSMTSNNEMRKIIEGLACNNTVLDGYVYFIEKIDSSGAVIAIKIGRSKNPSARLADLIKLDENVGFKLQQIHKIFSENCVALETEMHRKFKEFCIYNEWFKPVSEIYSEINKSYVMTTPDYDMQEERRGERDKRKHKDQGTSVAVSTQEKEYLLPDDLNHEAWEEWLAYRRAVGFKAYKKNAMSMGKVITNLIKLSGGNKALQMGIVQQSIANQYQGLFPLKGGVPVNYQADSVHWNSREAWEGVF